ncbi:MAG: ribosomal-protein-alanine N-acetyltransferase [Gemmatimonadetes bacterium RIFCSPLOWO2_12_FULL_68_9]|nr:MAG: ribosomal-protein-alanine N-acetyltransferase [Gemmatimonadetes bacterium RIFCSPLOWO2_12_FULL_68_9]
MPTDAPYRIRLAEPADLPQLAQIERRVFTDPWPEAGFRELLGPFTRVAVTGTETVAGYLVARCVLDEAEILNLAVHPDHERRGLGTTLVQDVLGDLGRAGARRVYLEVRASDAGAQAFYRRLGFETRGRRRGYYSNPPGDALILVRAISGP